MKTKKCSNCFIVKTWDQYYPRTDARGRPSVQSRCKTCNPEVVKAWKKQKFQRDFSAWVRSGGTK